MKSKKTPFFTVVIPLYNKANHVKETINTVLNQSFQDFEIVVINDGSTDKSSQIVKMIKDSRINLINQENQGVSVARNRGIKESNAKYIAFLDADDLWLSAFLQTIYNLINDFPDAGIYATAFKYMSVKSKDFINMKALPTKKYRGILSDYFTLTRKENYNVWTSALCIPRKIFIENNIWFPVGEKYGEDIYVWGKIAINFDIVYDTTYCSIYQIDTQNNTKHISSQVKEPPRPIFLLKECRKEITESKQLKSFDKYIENIFVRFILGNIVKGKKAYALKQIFKYTLSWQHRFKLLILLLIKNLKRKIL